MSLDLTSRTDLYRLTQMITGDDSYRSGKRKPARMKVAGR
jgi:hypothetical protein